MSELVRDKILADIVCCGFGPSVGGFLTTLSKNLCNEDGSVALESKVVPGCPLQLMCYERADDFGFAVSGVVSRARAIKETFSVEELQEIPMLHTVTKEKLLYLMDYVGASRRSFALKLIDKMLGLFKFLPLYRDFAFEIPWIPPFMKKDDGLLFTAGHFNQWVASRLMSSGLVQLWPSSPVKGPIVDGEKVYGVCLLDQGTNLQGEPLDGYMPGMEIEAELTVAGDGPVGALGQALNDKFGLPKGHHQKDKALGMRIFVDLHKDASSEVPGTILHTFGFPEPEIFGFMYFHPDNKASLGIFVPSWLDNPLRSSYYYLQQWMKHPYFSKYLKGAELRSWGAKTIEESGDLGAPYLIRDGVVRIGEGSGTTNVLSNSGFDEAWKSGSLLAEAVIDLIKQKKSLSKENLELSYLAKRKQSWLGQESKKAAKARQGFHAGILPGLIGMTLSWLSRGKINYPAKIRSSHERLPNLESYLQGKVSEEEIEKIKQQSYASGKALHEKLMLKLGWPEINYDGKLFMSLQDALFLGGKVQALGAYANHVKFQDVELCAHCSRPVCIEMCSGQAIFPDEKGIPQFDREKCVHCGACLWNCSQLVDEVLGKTNINFQAGAGGLHSIEN